MTVFKQPVYISAAVRTPLGNFQGELAPLSATALGSFALKAACERAGLLPDAVADVYMGCVLPAGLGQAPARQAALGAGLAPSVPCTTVNKVCGSGLKAVMIAAESAALSPAQAVLAGGMESMSNAPYLLEKARSGLRLGHGKVQDHMFLDGLEDAYDKGRLMGHFADATARHFNYSRTDQDAFALRSLERAKNAQEKGYFAVEIIPVLAKQNTISTDELPRIAKPEKIPLLKPAFGEGGTVTAANASSISDGAAALAIAGAETALPKLARIVGHTSYAGAPEWFTTAPVYAVQNLLSVLGWSVSDVDLFEVNEAFAVVALVAQDQLKIPAEKLNIWGGACALGHPIGASGARLLVTLIHALKATGGKRGIVSLCIGGGEAVALAVEIE